MATTNTNSSAFFSKFQMSSPRVGRSDRKLPSLKSMHLHDSSSKKKKAFKNEDITNVYFMSGGNRRNKHRRDSSNE